MKEAALQIEDLEAASPATSATVSTDMARGNCTGVAMRVVWGFVGSENARFSSFVKGPCTILTFVKHSLHLGAPHHLGHNPAGGAMIVLMLAMLAALCATGVALTIYGESGALEEVHEGRAYILLALLDCM